MKEPVSLKVVCILHGLNKSGVNYCHATSGLICFHHVCGVGAVRLPLKNVSRNNAI